ncbi:MAG: hypothetical protein EOM26_06480 [Alphaproteobacteria bacterium]|nr:hypothetical protein [Alphaproteobacteria bacterium]
MEVAAETISGRHADLLLDYARGSLDTALSILAESFLVYSAEARACVCGLEAVGGVLVETICEPVEMRENSLDNVLDRIGAIREYDRPPVAHPADLGGDLSLPSPVRPILPPLKRGEDFWRRSGDTLVCRLSVPGESSLHLLKMAPGTRSATRAHNDVAFVLVLEGGFVDEFAAYGPGDLAIYDRVRHTLLAHSETGCLCLVAKTAGPHP